MNLRFSLRRSGFQAPLFALTGILWGQSALHAAPLSVQVSRLDAGVPPRALEKIEFQVDLAGGKAPYSNPFDADEVKVDATFTGPGGRSLHIPGFWEQPFQRAAPNGGYVDMAPREGEKPGWRVRLRPTIPGKWSLTVAGHDGSGDTVSAPLTLNVAVGEKSRHGFIERATGAGHARYFQFNDGTPYFPVGENICWSGNRGLADFDEWFGNMQQAHANYARIWMANRPLESKETGLRHYDQKNAAYFDEVFSLAEERGLTCMVALGTYGEFTTGGAFNEGQWHRNPYNTANGGPVSADKPDDFFTDPIARRDYQNKLRYLVARYGAYTGVGFWELWNEKDCPAPWVSEMATLLKQTDPYQRPVTNSYSTVGKAPVWSLPNVDLTQTHRYGDEGSLRDIAAGMPADSRDHDVFGKPHLMGEFGISWRGTDAKFDPNGLATNLHNGLWSSAFSGNAGSAMIWWWDSYIGPKNLYHEFTPLADFTRRVDWPNRDFEPLEIPNPQRVVKEETFGDIRLEPAPVWGAKSTAPITVSPDKGAGGAGTLLSYLYNVNGNSPDKSKFKGPEELDVTMPHAGSLRLEVGLVTTSAKLQVTVDGVEAGVFPFDASPAGAGTYKDTKLIPDYGGYYQARFDAIREVPLTVGPHKIVIQNISGDWLQITAYQFTGLRSSKYTDLRPLALQDKTGDETLIWLQDQNSNWQSDRDGKVPDRWEGITLSVPVPGQPSFQVEWWDTRLGQPVGAPQWLTSQAGKLSLKVPTFTRDIAARIRSGAR